MDLSVQIAELERDGQQWALVRVGGDLDITTGPRLREQLVAVVTNGQPRIILDLDDLTFIDSTGLGIVVGMLKRTRSHGGDLRLVCTQPGVRKVFELTALDRTLPLAASPEEALTGTPPEEG